MSPEQPSFSFEGEPAYNVPIHILEAVCRDEEGVSIQELDQNEDGTFRNEAGDVFIKEGNEYTLKTKGYSPDFSDVLEKFREQYPNDSIETLEARTRDEIKRRRFAEAREAEAALLKELRESKLNDETAGTMEDTESEDQ